MPKSRVNPKKKYREFSVIDKKFIKDNYLKNVGNALKDIAENYDISAANFLFILQVYDLEFFTIKHAARIAGREEIKMRDRTITKLRKDGYVYKHFNRLTGPAPDATMEELIFREENKYSYRVRYALTQKARLLIARFYRKVGGEEQINFTSHFSEKT